MIKRIYIDNFRSLVNFELNLDRLNLFLGENGTGKTTVFDVIYRLRQFISGEEKVHTLFPARELTRWQNRGVQKFVLDLLIGQEMYNYELIVDHDLENRLVRVNHEQLIHDGKLLFEFNVGTAQLYDDNYNKWPQYPFDWTQSIIGSQQTRPDLKKMIRFRDEMRKIIVAGICPYALASESHQEEKYLSRRMENFTSWYRFLIQDQQSAVIRIFSELKKVLAGFNSLSLKEAGEDVRALKVLFDRPGGNGKPLSFDFSEISDGQRVLIVLYSLILGMKDDGLYFFLDEPDNYVALREIQPWLFALQDALGGDVEQAVLISHHPEIIDYLATSKGRWFDRDPGGPVRVSNQPKFLAEGLTPSENIARGWEHE